LSSPDDVRILLPRLDKKLDVDVIIIVIIIITIMCHDVKLTVRTPNKHYKEMTRYAALTVHYTECLQTKQCCRKM